MMATTQNCTPTGANREFTSRIDGKFFLVQEIGKSRYIAPIRPTATRTERGLEIGYKIIGSFVKVS